MRPFPLAILGYLLPGAVFGPATAAPAARTTAAVRAASAPTIDGKLDEPEWTAAPPSLLHPLSPSPISPEY